MAYYVMCEKKRGEYIPIDITKSGLFVRNSRLVGTGLTLQEIDNFTMQFNDITELRNFLYKEKILIADYCDKPLSIRLVHKAGNLRKVGYDFLYQKDLEYVLDPKKLVTDINNRLRQKDFRFILEYANHFFNYYDCSDISPEVRAFSKDSLDFGYVNRHFYEYDENGDNPLVRMTKQLIYEYRRYDYGKLMYFSGVKYRNLHDVIAFYDNYDSKVLLEKNEKSKTKSLIKKQEQLSFFD